MALHFTKAVRQSVPLMISVAGTSGSGKTYSALLLAAGLVKPGGKVAFLDTENKRGSMYADSPGIKKALPDGYDIMQMDAPFAPRNYIEAISAAEAEGYDVLVIDSFSHEWEGIGGCQEIAENNKLGRKDNWAMAKREHKRLVNHLLSTQMHVIFCLRARDKVKMVKRGDPVDQFSAEVYDKDLVLPMGLQPIAEKNFVFEMVVSLLLDEKTHFASPLKVPEPLAHLFPGRKLLTKEDGARIREWNSTGSVMDTMEKIKQRTAAVAQDGLTAYAEYFQGTLTKEQRKALIDSGDHETNKATAQAADAEREALSKEQAELEKMEGESNA